MRIPVTDFCVTIFAANDASANTDICTDPPRGQRIYRVLLLSLGGGIDSFCRAFVLLLSSIVSEAALFLRLSGPIDTRAGAASAQGDKATDGCSRKVRLAACMVHLMRNNAISGKR